MLVIALIFVFSTLSRSVSLPFSPMMHIFTSIMLLYILCTACFKKTYIRRLEWLVFQCHKGTYLFLPYFLCCVYARACVCAYPGETEFQITQKHAVWSQMSMITDAHTWASGFRPSGSKVIHNQSAQRGMWSLRERAWLVSAGPVSSPDEHVRYLHLQRRAVPERTLTEGSGQAKGGMTSLFLGQEGAAVWALGSGGTS